MNVGTSFVKEIEMASGHIDELLADGKRIQVSLLNNRLPTLFNILNQVIEQN